MLYKNNPFRANDTQTIIDGDSIIFKSGENKFIAEIVSDYSENLRIYGINDNNERGWSPLAYATYFLVAGPYRGDSIDCERDDALNAPFLNIIVEDQDLKNEINKLKSVQGRRSATLIGKKIRIKKFIYKDEDHTDVLKRQGRMDPASAIMIDEIITGEEE